MRVIFYKIAGHHTFPLFVPRRIYHEEQGVERGILYEIKATRER